MPQKPIKVWKILSGHGSFYMNMSEDATENISSLIDSYLESQKGKVPEEKIASLTKIRNIIVKDNERSEQIAKCITDNKDKDIGACLIEYDKEMMGEE